MNPVASPSSPRWLPEFLLLSVAWGISFLFMRGAVVEFGALPTAALRTGVAALMLTPVLLMRGLGAELLLHWRKLFLVGIVNSGIPFACYAFALLSISTGLSSIINATTPLFGALIAWAWLGDRPGRSRAVGLAVGFAGVALLAWNKASFRPDASGVATGWAVIACLVATLCYGLGASLAKKHLGGIPTLVTAAGSQIGATLGLLVPALWFWPAQMPGASAWASAVAVGVFSTGLAYVLYFRLIEKTGPSKVLAVTFVLPVVAVTAGAIFLGEAITPWMIFCGLVIVFGTALATGLLKFPAVFGSRKA